MSFHTFLAKYAVEARTIAATFTGILNQLPLQHDDKRNLLEAANTLNVAAANVEEFLRTTHEPVAATPSQDMIMRAVATFLKSPEGRAILATPAAPKPATKSRTKPAKK